MPSGQMYLCSFIRTMIFCVRIDLISIAASRCSRTHISTHFSFFFRFRTIFIEATGVTSVCACVSGQRSIVWIHLNVSVCMDPRCTTFHTKCKGTKMWMKHIYVYFFFVLFLDIQNLRSQNAQMTGNVRVFECGYVSFRLTLRRTERNREKTHFPHLIRYKCSSERELKSAGGRAQPVRTRSLVTIHFC